MKPLYIALLFAGLASAAEAEGCIFGNHKADPGDTLSVMAQTFYGPRNWRQWPLIKAANEGKVRGSDTIFAGTEYTIPCYFSDQTTKPKFTVGTKRFVPVVMTALAEKAVETELPDITAALYNQPYSIPLQFYPAPKPVVEANHLGDGPAEGEIAASESPASEPILANSLLPQTKPSPAELEKTANSTPTKGPKVAATPAKKPAKKYFQVLFNATGVNPGAYPALFLRDQDKKGFWHHSNKMVIVVEKIGEALYCRVVLDKKPVINSAVVIDWGNGQAFYVAGDILVQGKEVEVSKPKNLRRKAYVSLKTTFPSKHHPIVSALRIFGPTAMRSGLAFAAIGPQGVILAPASLATDLLMRRLRSDQAELARLSAPRLEIQYEMAGQQTEINKLKTQIVALQAQLANLKQTVTQVSASKEGN